MDIGKFFKKTFDADIDVTSKQSGDSDESLPKKIKLNACVDNTSIEPIPSTSGSATPAEPSETCYKEKYDLGRYVDQVIIPDDIRYTLLTNPFKPSSKYNFDGDVSKGKRCFRREWLEQYDWMSYSSELKGPLCRYCVLFKPVVRRGLLGAFIVKEFKNYKDLHECARRHMKSEWHRNSTAKAVSFKQTVAGKSATVSEQLNNEDYRTVEENRKKLKPIISTIIFCGTHYISLRGKDSNQGNFEDLLNFRIESGDKLLDDHMKTCHKKSKYTSHQIQNELIDICGSVIKKRIVSEVNNSVGLSLLADETADITGVEQLSVGLRYVDKENVIREEFLGFTDLKSMNAQTISQTILTFARDCGLHLDKLLGLGFDGCSTMAGKENGVQKLIRDEYPKATFFHCSSHRLNLVVNDLNAVQEVQNTICTIKEVIRFFRESPKRRILVSNVPMLCETRWTAKYKSIRLFAENFSSIKSVLQDIATDKEEFNLQSRSKANQLCNATSVPQFIICLKIIARYSSQLEPVTNKLQGISVDLLSVQKHIKDLVSAFKDDRENSEEKFSGIFRSSVDLASEFDIELRTPRITGRQIHRANVAATTAEEYFRRNVFIPYLDSLICSLELRFSEHTSVAFSIARLHPANLRNTTDSDFVNLISGKYDIENLEAEYSTWVQIWKDREVPEHMDFAELIARECDFFPAMKKAFLIFLTMPPTTCSIERSFSTLRRVKTWLRSSMGESRLSGLCLLSVHRKKVEEDKQEFIDEVVEIFGQKRRNLKFLFS